LESPLSIPKAMMASRDAKPSHAEQQFRYDCCRCMPNVPPNYVFIDFEYRPSPSSRYDLVCVSYKIGMEATKSIWIYRDENARQELIATLKSMQYSHIFVQYSNAESNSFLSLGLNPRAFQWIDLMAEFGAVRNHFALSKFGQQLTAPTSLQWKDSEATSRYKADMDKDERAEDSRNDGRRLIHALFKFCWDSFDIGAVRTKERIVPIIIGPIPTMMEHKAKILEYCASDVELLPSLWQRIYSFMHIHCPEATQGMVIRGRVAANYSIIRYNGLPVHPTWALNLGKSADMLITDLILAFEKDNNIQLPREKTRLSLAVGAFFALQVEQHYKSYSERLGREWPRSLLKYPVGELKGQLQALTSSDLFEEMQKKTGNRQTLPEKILELKQQVDKLNKLLFLDKDSAENAKKRVKLGDTSKYEDRVHRFLLQAVEEKRYDNREDIKDLWGNIDMGGDFRSRPYINYLAQQSARCSVSTSAFIPALPSHFRSIIMPPKGKVIIDIDYSSQEVLLSGLYYDDPEVVDAYNSGDVYLAFGRDIGIIHDGLDNATRTIYRLACKSAVLGMSYGLGAAATRAKVETDLGPEAFAKVAHIDFHKAYWDNYSTMKLARRNAAQQYQSYKEALYLPYISYPMGPDNPNSLSVLNQPVQGRGASIMYYAVDQLISRGHKVVWTLHDAIAIEANIATWESDLREAMEIMRQAAEFCVPGASAIRMEADVFGYDIPPMRYAKDDPTFGTEVRTYPVFVDPRSVNKLVPVAKYIWSKEEIVTLLLPTLDKVWGRKVTLEDVYGLAY
jgi:hypothetical protein